MYESSWDAQYCLSKLSSKALNGYFGCFFMLETSYHMKNSLLFYKTYKFPTNLKPSGS